LEKVNQDVYQREYQRQQAEQQRQQRASSQHSEGPVCGLSFQIIAILFAAFAGLANCYSLFIVVFCHLDTRSCQRHRLQFRSLFGQLRVDCSCQSSPVRANVIDCPSNKA
jgi:hypothetical protein